MLTRTSCHWLPSAMSTYRRGLVVIRGSGLWLFWVIHNIHIQINRKAFAHGFVFALAFCSSQPSSVRVIAPVQSYKNTESDTRRNHQHGHAAWAPALCTYCASNMGPAFISVKIQRFDPAERNYFIARLGEKLQERAKDSDRERGMSMSVTPRSHWG